MAPVPERHRKLKPAEFHILLVLAREELHGLGIAKAVDEATEGATRLGPGTLYRALKALTALALVEPAASPDGADDPRRRFYRITEEGHAAVRAEATRLARLVHVAEENAVLPGRP